MKLRTKITGKFGWMIARLSDLELADIERAAPRIAECMRKVDWYR